VIHLLCYPKVLCVGWDAIVARPTIMPFINSVNGLCIQPYQGSNLKCRVPFRFEGLVDSEPFNADMQN